MTCYLLRDINKAPCQPCLTRNAADLLAMQTVAMLGPAACLVAASIDTNGTGEMVVPLITLALGLSSFSLAGLYCTHQDMSPKYAGEVAAFAPGTASTHTARQLPAPKETDQETDHS